MKYTLAAIILATGVSTAIAQPQDRGPRDNRGSMFDRVDANGDEYVDLKELTEFHAVMQQRGPRGNRARVPNVDNQDTNTDNNVTPPARKGRGPGNRGTRAMPSPEEIIKTHDKDGDGKLSRDEFTMGNQRQGRGRGPGRGPGQRAKTLE